jgi:hypothetical protein
MKVFVLSENTSISENLGMTRTELLYRNRKTPHIV